MNYVNYKKNELRKLTVSDIDLALPNLKNTNKSEEISKWIMKWIDTDLKKGQIEIGNLLPTKAEFAYSLGVSLGTIQNTFKILEDKNYIFLKQRIGAIIKDKKDTSIKVRKQTSKQDIATEEIKTYIKNTKLGIGDKLPSSRQLSKLTEISLNTIRVSVNKLMNDNILEYNNKKELIIKNILFETNEYNNESLVNKVRNDLKQYISTNFKVGERLPSHGELADKFKVSMKTIHSAIKFLEKDEMLLSRRGTYGTIVINTSVNSAFEPKKETSIFASAQETAFYHYEKVQNKLKDMIVNKYGMGSKLPSIRDLSTTLDLSPNTIRKALYNLADDGILRFARGRYGGTFVIDMPDIEEQTFRWLAVDPQYTKVKVN